MTVEADILAAGLSEVAPATKSDALVQDFAFNGYVDFYGYHSMAGGWFFAGWAIRRDDLADQLQRVVAIFDDQTITQTTTDHVSTLFLARDDISSQAIGFLIFLRAAPASQTFKWLRIKFDNITHHIFPVEQSAPLCESRLVPKLKFIVSLSEPGPQRREMETLLDGNPETNGTGYVEYSGYHATAGGWFCSGWVSRGWSNGLVPADIVMSFENGDVRGEVVATLFARPELPEGAHGAIFFIRAGGAESLGAFCSLSVLAGGVRSVLPPIVAAPSLREAELTARLRANLELSRPGLMHDRLENLLTRLPYIGEDTIDALAPDIFFYVDDAICCGHDGLVLIGWMLAKTSEIREVRLRSGKRSTVLDMRNCVRVERPDVISQFAKYGYDDSACGFVAYLPGALEPDTKPFIEAETQRLETGFRNIIRPALTGMAAIKRLLGTVDVRFGEMRHAFDNVLGPAVEAINRTRLAAPVGLQVVEYGAVPTAPKFSVIVPIHGRLDFVEYQIALFSARPEAADVEFIYVVDDPPKRREAQTLFASIHERFLIPFRAILLDRNVGFAPANNIGLRHAHGEFIAFLNSDVFPGTQDWLETLSGQLIEDPKIGVIGPLLLFEDGSVQHRGMYFERLAEYGDWFFCQHHDKGLRYTGGSDLQHFISITGACMVLRREIANQLGGFDETYVIGDFEDSDLCLKLQALGYKCAVDPDVRLYHLERKSQASNAVSWRPNLTAYNAWQHERRWTETIAEKQGAAFGGRA